MSRSVSKPSNRRRRLQRDKDFTGDRLSSFGEVFLRHGLPGLALAVGFLSIPELWPVLCDSLERPSTHFVEYTFAFIFILLILNAYAWLIDRQWNAAKLGWIIYLGALSLWEEWIFRLAFPQVLERLGASVWMAAMISALAFAGAHYFTLRWKWHWCLAAFFGSLALSRQMELHSDLLLISAMHWVATYLNTPRLPGRLSSIEAISTDRL